MATNKVQDGDILRLTVASTVVSGDPVQVGGISGVALTSYSATDGKCEVEICGAYNLSVQAVNDAGNSAVAIGDRLYFGGSATPWLSKKKSRNFFGIALAEITSGTTATISVLIGEPSGNDNSSHSIFAAGIVVVNDDPIAAAEFIPITGVLDTDVVLVTFAVNDTPLTIVSAVASTSLGGITVTASATFAAGDTLNYAVLRPTT